MSHLTENPTKDLKETSFIHNIKRSTAALHLRLETQTLLAAIMSPAVTRLQYCFYLTLMKKIEEVYESSIVTRLPGIILATEQRKASLLISDDLHSLGDIVEAGLAMKDFTIPAGMNSIPFALGFTYVMKGSKLGGKVIYKHIHRTLGYSESCGAKFIADYGIDTFGLWKKFLSQVSMYVTQHDCEEETIQGAEYAFSSIYDFFESNSLVYEHQGYR